MHFFRWFIVLFINWVLHLILSARSNISLVYPLPRYRHVKRSGNLIPTVNLYAHSLQLRFIIQLYHRNVGLYPCWYYTYPHVCQCMRNGPKAAFTCWHIACISCRRAPFCMIGRKRWACMVEEYSEKDKLTGDQWILRTKSQQSGKSFHLVTSSWVPRVIHYGELFRFKSGMHMRTFGNPPTTRTYPKIYTRCAQCQLTSFGECGQIHPTITVTSWWARWRLNYRRLDCLLNRLFRRMSKKTSKLCVTGPCEGIRQRPVDSHHKGPVTWVMFPFDYVIMKYINE